MGIRTSYTEGTFCWTDLATTDIPAAKKFYGEAMGWTFEDKPTPHGPYCMAKYNGKEVTALFGLPPEMKTPFWSSYISVNDVVAMTKTAKENGATVLTEPTDVMTAGKMAVIQDPTGAPLGLWQKGDHFGAEYVNHPGAFCWNELWTRDSEAAKTFCTKTFGWDYDVQTEPNPYITIKNKTTMNGGILDIKQNSMPAETPAHWNVYFSVENTDNTIEKVVGLGGKLMVGPVDIPVGRFAVVSDPQGGTFTIIQMPEIDE